VIFLSGFGRRGCYTLTMTSDGELLRRYAGKGSEEAFAELVRRHLDLVYSAALRQVNGDAPLAEDIAQTVFADLARKAASLSERQVLTGWLYTSTHFAAAKAVRSERRRHAREQEAHAMQELLVPTPDFDWARLRPVLDAAMHQLEDTDRDAILLRYFENRPLADIGDRLGVSEDAARKRVERALDKLRVFLSRTGITTTALALALSTSAVQAAPSGLAATVAVAALAGTTKGGALTLLKIMAMTKLKLGVATLLVVGAAATLFLQRENQRRLRQENDSLRQQVAQLIADGQGLSNRLAQARQAASPRLPAPQFRSASTAPQLEPTTAGSLYDRWKDRQTKLTGRQITGYLNANHRNAASLLAAYRTTGDAAFLTEAMQRFPNDPQVTFEAAFRKDAPAEDRRQWLETFKKSAPENALPSYLSALDYFKAGQADAAVREVVAATGKSQFQDYTLDRVQEDEDAYLAAGYSVAEAKTVPARQLLLPQLGQVKELGLDLVDLAKSYRQAGDATSAQTVLQMTADLAQRYSAVTPGEAEISQLVGLALERIALTAMDPSTPYGNNGQTVQDRLSQIAQQNATLKDLNQQLEPLLPTMADEDWISYKDRWRMFGEEAAMRWVIGKYGPP